MKENSTHHSLAETHHQNHGHQQKENEKKVPWYQQGVFWGGVFAGVVLMGVILGANQMWEFRFGNNWGASSYWNSPFNMMNGPGMMGLYPDYSQQYGNDPFEEMRAQMNDLDRRNQQLFDQFKQFRGGQMMQTNQPQNRLTFQTMPFSKYAGSGEFAFNVGGYNFSMPYQFANQKLTMDLTSLRKYMNGHPTSKVNLEVISADGKTLLSVKGPADAKENSVDLDYKNGGKLLINLKIDDADGKSLVNVQQVI